MHVSFLWGLLFSLPPLDNSCPVPQCFMYYAVSFRMSTFRIFALKKTMLIKLRAEKSDARSLRYFKISFIR